MIGGDAPRDPDSRPTGRLIVLAGLPGTGKTTLAQALVRHLGATWVQIDALERAFRETTPQKFAYRDRSFAFARQAGAAIAQGNLPLGRDVVIDAVNAGAGPRALWRDLATETMAPLLRVELTCSDSALHRSRIETRRDARQRLLAPGVNLPGWAGVMLNPFDPWEDAELRIDTAVTDGRQVLAMVLDRLSATGPATQAGPIDGPIDGMSQG